MFGYACLFTILILINVTVEYSDEKSFQSFLYSMKKQSIDDLSNVFRRRLGHFRKSDNKQVELVFLIDGSSSVGEANFESEVKFVRKLVADLILGSENVRIAVVVFDSGVKTYVNHLNSTDSEKCTLLLHELPKIRYVGGNTFTLGAVQEATIILEQARTDAKKIVFLITDGFSNNGDPVPVAYDLKKYGTKIFAFGITSGNMEELYRMSSPPSEEHAFFLESFSEFEALARRALHEDLGVGVYTPVSSADLCSHLCANSTSCCNANSTCSCGNLSGIFSCLCPPGYFGTGLVDQDCLPCPSGTYHDGKAPGDVTVCRSCPDRNQKMKKFPATSINDCVCEDGFIPVGTTCNVITCPKLSPPKNGYFVKENCSNVLNAACGVRCDIGYELIGSSVRICQKNGTWSGDQPMCQPKKCGQLSPFDHGEVTCKHEDEGFEVFVEFGARGVRTREIVKRKSGIEANGPDVENMTFGVDTECRFACPIGFNLIGSKKRSCLPITRWNGLQATCKPITCTMLPPIAHGEISPSNCTQRGLRHSYATICNVSCDPGFILKGNTFRHCTGKHGTWTGKGQIYKCLDVEPPKLKCPQNMSTMAMPNNNVATINITLPKATDNSAIPPILWAEPNVTVLPIGMHEIKIHAVDASTNAAVCSYWVQVNDIENPKMENCSSPPPMLLRELLQLDWDEPSFHDNSGNVTVYKSHSEDVDNGTLTFNYTALDPSGNSATCLINATLLDFVCSKLPLQNNTEGNCPHGTNSCVIYCAAGFASPIRNVTLSCINGQWVSPSRAEIPLLNCSEVVDPKENLVTGSLLIQLDNFCGGASTIEDLQELTNQILIEIDDSNLSLLMNCTTEEESNEATRRRRSVQKTSKVDFNISGKWEKFFYKTGESRTEVLRNKISNSSGLQVRGRSVIIGSVEPLAELLSCHEGSIPVREYCVKCSVGHFYDSARRGCHACPLGTFQNVEGSLQCQNCPIGATTLRQGTISSHQCRKICLEGTYGSRVNSEGISVAPCWPCPRGHYQPLQGQTSCLSCWRTPLAAACHSAGMRCRIDTCRNNGTCSLSSYSCICPNGYFGNACEKHFSPCDSSPCVNGAKCDEKSRTEFSCSCALGYQGELCQHEVDHCLSGPCLNGGTCSSLHNGFHCDCPDNFQGETCGDTIDTCKQLQPCQNNGSCISLSGNFKCECQQEYFGQYCDRYRGCLGAELTICEGQDKKSSSCTTEGTCLQRKAATFDTETVFNFPRGSPTHYLIADLNYQPFEQISACVWIQTKDQFNFGTLFSFASEHHDNEFTLSDYNGLVLYVQGERVVTDVVVNNGFWNFVCVTWKSANGSWKIYQDGKVAANGTNLSQGQRISGIGSLVVGQEQDFPGGGFNPVESFVGKLARFQVWKSELSEEKIHELAESCDEPIVGTGLKILHDIRGDFKKESSIFCKGCGEPPPIFRADAALDGKVARYRCNDGFLIKFVDDPSPLASTNWTRQCQISGEWQPNPPICIRVSCGFPGFLPHGSLIGRSYLYEDTVRFKCKEGYELVGPRRRNCLANGTWSEVKPYCRGCVLLLEKSGRSICPSLTAPRRGALFLLSRRPGLDGDSLPGDQGEFTCDLGFRLNGPRVLTCLAAGLWSSPPPDCTPCPDFLVPC